MTVGENIKKLRMERNLTQQELSAKMGYLSTGVLSKLENDRMEPNLNHLIRLGIALRVPEEVITNVTGIPQAEEQVMKDEISKREAELKKQVVQEAVKEEIAPAPVLNKNQKNEDEIKAKTEHEETEIEIVVEDAINLEEVDSIVKISEAIENEKLQEEKTIDENLETSKAFQENVNIETEVIKDTKKTSEDNLQQTKQYPFYNNVGTIILSVILICLPLLMIEFFKKSDGLYILIGSSLIVVVLIISLLLNKSKKKDINFQAPTPITYGTRIPKKALVLLKIVLVLLSLGFIVLGFYYIKEIEVYLTTNLLKYGLYSILGLSALMKLITSLIVKIKNPTNQVTSLTMILVIAFVLDLIATIGFGFYLNNKNILNTQNGLIFLVSMNLISYTIILINNRISSLFRYIESK